MPADLSEVHRSLGRIEGMIGEMKDANEKQFLDLKVELAAGKAGTEHAREGFEKRMSKVENRQHWYSGAAAAVGVIITHLLAPK